MGLMGVIGGMGRRGVEVRGHDSANHDTFDKVIAGGAAKPYSHATKPETSSPRRVVVLDGKSHSTSIRAACDTDARGDEPCEGHQQQCET